MPIIEHVDYEIPLVIIAGGSSFFAAAEVEQYFRATLPGSSNMFPAGTLELLGSITIAGTSAIEAFGRIDDEPNVFGVGDFGGASSLDLIGRLFARGKAIIAGSSTLTFQGRVSESESSLFRILLTIADLPGVGHGATYSARVLADGVAYPIRGYSLSEGTAESGVSLELTLQKPGDRNAVLSAGEFTFDIYDNGSWKPIFQSGRRTGGQFSFGWANAKANDALSISTAGPIAEKLEKSPRRNLTVYDPTREEINASDFEGIHDENGILYAHELKAISDMRLYQLLNYLFVTRCGFTRVETSIPNDPVRRLDVNVTESFNDAAAGILGTYRPLVFVENDVLKILDSSVALPAGFAAPIALQHSQYKNAEFTVTEQAADGFIVRHVDQDADFDYYSDRDVPLPDKVFGSEGSSDYTETQTVLTYRDFYKLSSPAVPIRTEKIRHVTTIRGMLAGTLQELSETTERSEFDSKLRLRTIEKRKTAAIPDLSETFPIITREIRRETTRFEYKPDIKNPRREVLATTSKRVTGLILTDDQNLHLDQPFKQEFYDAWRSGNFTGEGQTVESGTIATEIETLEQNPRGQNEMRFVAVDYMTNPPNVHGDVTDARGGDPTTNAETSGVKDVIVYRTGLTDRTDAKLVVFPGGEFRISNLRALAKRLLDKRQVRTGTIELKGLNLAFGRGSVLTLYDRDGNSAGSYIVEGRSITGQNLGTREQRTSQVLQVQEIATNAGPITIGVAQAGGILLNAGGTLAFTLSIACESGYSLTAESEDANVRFWAKATAGGSFQNIHSSPIDLTPFAGTAHTFYFELRIDGAAADGTQFVSIEVRRV